MRSPFQFLVAALLLGTAATWLTACSTTPSPAVSTPTSSVASSSGLSRDSAITEARHAYQAYVALDSRTTPKNFDERAFAPFLTAKAIKAERVSTDAVAKRGLRVVGQVVVTKFIAQRWDASAMRLSAYACLDLAKTRVIDETGKDVTPQDRIEMQTALARFELTDGVMKLAEDGLWSGPSVC